MNKGLDEPFVTRFVGMGHDGQRFYRLMLSAHLEYLAKISRDYLNSKGASHEQEQAQHENDAQR